MKHGCSITEAAMLIFKQLFCEIEPKLKNEVRKFDQ